MVSAKRKHWYVERTSMVAHIYLSVLQAVSGRGYAGYLDACFQGYRSEAMQDLGYGLPREHILGTRVNSALEEFEDGLVDRGVPFDS